MSATDMMKGLEALLFGGAALGFCWWQIRSVRRLQRERAEQEAREAARPSAVEKPPG